MLFFVFRNTRFLLSATAVAHALQGVHRTQRPPWQSSPEEFS